MSEASEPIDGEVAAFEYLPGNSLTAEQELRMRSVELVASVYKDSLVNGRPPTTSWLVTQAKPIEAYVLGAGYESVKD